MGLINPKMIQTFKDHSLYSGSLHCSSADFVVTYETDNGIFWIITGRKL
jgi:hypothetical protein